MRPRCFLQTITGRMFALSVATSAQRFGRDSWEADALPLSYSRSMESSSILADARSCCESAARWLRLRDRRPDQLLQAIEQLLLPVDFRTVAREVAVAQQRLGAAV